VRLFLFSLLLLTGWSPVFPNTLWAVDSHGVGGGGGTVSNLWQIDTTTGLATQIVTLDTTASFVGDITVLNGTIYGGAGDAGKGFSSIDPTTGVLTVINGAAPIQGLAVNPNIPLFYEDGSTGNDFNTITPAGSRTVIGGGGDFIRDLAYDSVHGVLYGWDSATVTLNTIDPSTGAATSLPTSFANPRLGGAIGFDWTNNTLYFLNDSDDNLYSLNTTTGAPTLIGPTGLTGVVFVGLADLPVPEPSSGALIAIGMGGLALARQARRRQQDR
jgi:PEP-CTERM motif